MNYSGTIPQYNEVVFGDAAFTAGEVISFSVTLTGSTTSTDIVLGDSDGSSLHFSGGDAPVSFQITIPTSQNYQFHLINGFSHSDGPVNAVVSCGGNSSTAIVPGPSIPTNSDGSMYAIHTITCTTPVFDSPGGKPVGDNIIKASQTWYVGSTPAKDSTGKLWTAIFVGGSNVGYVPTVCVS